MPNVPAQFPNIDLPGAEFFSLAPNASVALQGRRRFSVFPTATSVPASGQALLSSTLTLEQGFTGTSGIYLHAFWLTIGPSAAGLVVQNTFAGLTLRSGALFPDYILGNPTLTNPTINISTSVLSDRDRLITAKDILAPGAANGNPGLGTTLSLLGQIAVNNPTAGAITASANITIIYTRLDGLTE